LNDSPLLSYNVEEIQTHALLCAGKMKLLSLIVQVLRERERVEKVAMREDEWEGKGVESNLRECLSRERDMES